MNKKLLPNPFSNKRSRPEFDGSTYSTVSNLVDRMNGKLTFWQEYKIAHQNSRRKADILTLKNCCKIANIDISAFKAHSADDISEGEHLILPIYNSAGETEFAFYLGRDESDYTLHTSCGILNFKLDELEAIWIGNFIFGIHVTDKFHSKHKFREKKKGIIISNLVLVRNELTLLCGLAAAFISTSLFRTRLEVTVLVLMTISLIILAASQRLVRKVCVLFFNQTVDRISNDRSKFRSWARTLNLSRDVDIFLRCVSKNVYLIFLCLPILLCFILSYNITPGLRIEFIFFFLAQILISSRCFFALFILLEEARRFDNEVLVRNASRIEFSNCPWQFSGAQYSSDISSQTYGISLSHFNSLLRFLGSYLLHLAVLALLLIFSIKIFPNVRLVDNSLQYTSFFIIPFAFGFLVAAIFHNLKIINSFLDRNIEVFLKDKRDFLNDVNMIRFIGHFNEPGGNMHFEYQFERHGFYLVESSTHILRSLFLGELNFATDVTTYVNGTDSRLLTGDLKVRILDVYDQIFEGTVLENIVPDRTLVDLNAISEFTTHYGFDSFVRELPNGYATRLQDNGMNVDEGYRFVILLARAIYSRPNLLIYDQSLFRLPPRFAQLFSGIFSALRHELILVVINPQNIDIPSDTIRY